MKPLIIFRHSPNEGPGTLADILDDLNIPYHLVRVDQGDTVPDALGEMAGIVFMGGPMSVNDNLPWIAEEVSLIRRAAEIHLPVLGHCLGGQLISKALGGHVTANPRKEIGWYPVQVVANGPACDWLDGLPAEFEVFHWHGETFTIPPGATHILQGHHCANQAFVIGTMLALQCHIEMTAGMVMQWANQEENEITQPSESVQSAAQMTRNLPGKIAGLQKVAKVIYTRWLQLLPQASPS